MCSSSPKLKRKYQELQPLAASTAPKLKVLQWNTLADGLAQHGGFLKAGNAWHALRHWPCLSQEPLLQVEPKLLTWEHRAPIILEQLLEADADVLCLQEVNHFGGSRWAGC